MHIKGLVRAFEGSGYYRIQQPLEELAKHGHTVELGIARSDVKADGADLIVGQMIGSAFEGPTVHRWWRRLALQCRRIYELDDDPFEIEPCNPVYWPYCTVSSRDSLMHCLETADLVTCSTAPLAERMAKINPHVVVLKNRIDESLLAMERPRRDKLVIGWAGGSSHGEDLKEAAYGLRRTLQHHPQCEAHFIGNDFSQLIRQPARFTRWEQKTTEYYKLIDFDIGIAPLRATMFTRCKSAIKALEYAALGIPVVASDVQPYRDFVIDGVTGWLVNRPHEWAQRLRDLVNDEAMRTEMGAKAREHAAGWTIQQAWPEWEAAYASVL